MQTSSLFCFATDFESIGKPLNYKISNNPAERLVKYRQLFGSVAIYWSCPQLQYPYIINGGTNVVDQINIYDVIQEDFVFQRWSKFVTYDFSCSFFPSFYFYSVELSTQIVETVDTIDQCQPFRIWYISRIDCIR